MFSQSVGSLYRAGVNRAVQVELWEGRGEGCSAWVPSLSSHRLHFLRILEMDGSGGQGAVNCTQLPFPIRRVEEGEEGEEEGVG